MTEILQFSRAFFIGGSEKVPHGLLVVHAQDKGKTGCMLVSYKEEIAPGIISGGRVTSSKVNLNFAAVAELNPGFYADHDYFFDLLIKMVIDIGEERFGDGKMFVTEALKEVPATLFLTGWRILKLKRKDEE